jgi:hypothetical protein
LIGVVPYVRTQGGFLFAHKMRRKKEKMENFENKEEKRPLRIDVFVFGTCTLLVCSTVPFNFFLFWFSPLFTGTYVPRYI